MTATRRTGDGEPLHAGGPDGRERAWAAARSTRFDLVVVGAGISGVSVARDAALRGLRVLVIERGDVACGTSSGSTKLAHGGFRYLQQGHLRLVRTACVEREILRRLAPHLVTPLQFLFPSHAHGVFPSRPVSPFLLHAGLTAYDLFSGSRGHRHRMVSAGALAEAEPLIRTERMRGAAIYDDAVLDDARLTYAVLAAAMRAGATALTRAALCGVARDGRGRVRAVQVRDSDSGLDVEVATRAVVLACGPWGDEARRVCGIEPRPPLRLTQGVHAVVPFAACPVRRAVVLTSPADGRLSFAVPWEGVTLLGTTDTDVPSAGAARIRADDVRYILDATRATLPGAAVGFADVQATTVAVRPLVAREDGRNAAPSDVPREHAVVHDAGGVFTLAGGKLTTARAVAQEVTDEVAAWLSRAHGVNASPCQTRTVLLEGAGESVAATQVAPDVAARWCVTYGDQSWHLVQLIATRPSLADPVDGGDTRLLNAEVVHMARHELARTVADVLARRSRLALVDADNGLGFAAGVARVLGDELGWDVARRDAEVATYRAEIAAMHAWRAEGVA